MLKDEKLSNLVLSAAFNVHNFLGPGLLENAYLNTLCIELKSRNISFTCHKEYPIVYKNELAAKYIADLVVEERIIIELKSVKNVNNIMEAQLINYLKLAQLKIGYLINFHNQRVEWKRIVC